MKKWIVGAFVDGNWAMADFDDYNKAKAKLAELAQKTNVVFMAKFKYGHEDAKTFEIPKDAVALQSEVDRLRAQLAEARSKAA